jgi:hypothetical protein
VTVPVGAGRGRAPLPAGQARTDEARARYCSDSQAGGSAKCCPVSSLAPPERPAYATWPDRPRRPVLVASARARAAAVRSAPRRPPAKGSAATAADRRQEAHAVPMQGLTRRAGQARTGAGRSASVRTSLVHSGSVSARTRRGPRTGRVRKHGDRKGRPHKGPAHKAAARNHRARQTRHADMAADPAAAARTGHPGTGCPGIGAARREPARTGHRR